MRAETGGVHAGRALENMTSAVEMLLASKVRSFTLTFDCTCEVAIWRITGVVSQVDELESFT